MEINKLQINYVIVQFAATGESAYITANTVSDTRML